MVTEASPLLGLLWGLCSSPSLPFPVLTALHQTRLPPLPSGGSRPLGPEGWKPPRAHSIICLFCTSTALPVSLSSLSWQAGNSFPARLLATWRGQEQGQVRVAKVGGQWAEHQELRGHAHLEDFVDGFAVHGLLIVSSLVERTTEGAQWHERLDTHH